MTSEEESIIAGVRKAFEELVLPELRALGCKMDEFQASLEAINARHLASLARDAQASAGSTDDPGSKYKIN